MGQFFADFVRSGALPYDGIGVGQACIFVPEHGGLPLVGNADGGQIRTVNSFLFKSASNDILGVLPDLRWIVFHPTRLGKDLGKLLLRT